MDPYKHKLQQESLQAPPHRRGLEAGECDRMTEDAASCHLLVIPLTQPWKTLNPKLWSRWSEARDPAAGDRQVATVYIVDILSIATGPSFLVAQVATDGIAGCGAPAHLCN